MRLKVLNSLPRRHQNYLFNEISRLCRAFIFSSDIPSADREAETRELFSEVMAKLLGAASLDSDEVAELESDRRVINGEDPDQLQDPEGSAEPVREFPVSAIVDDVPARDQRVAWLIREVGSRRAIAHRYEDLRRQRWGRWRGSSYRTVQISALTEANAETQAADEVLAAHADRSFQARAEPEDPHDAEDTRRVWRGLLALAKCQFGLHEDVSLLLELLAQDQEIQASFGAEWPIARIVNALNQRHPHPRWTDDRVDNAKKRLRNWIGRLKQQHGLDANDLRDLLARYGRREGAESWPAHRSNLGQSRESPPKRTGP